MTLGGKVSLLRPEYVTKLQRAAKQLRKFQRRAGKYQWIIGRMVNDEWNHPDNADIRAELHKEVFYAESSREINKILPFPICSPETLRRWCEVDASYQNMRPEVEPLKDILSFEHFRVARKLAALPENEAKFNTPEHILAFAYAEEFTVDEMEKHFDSRKLDGVPEYTRVLGWFDSLQTASLEWIRSEADKAEYVQHITAARSIAERYH